VLKEWIQIIFNSGARNKIMNGSILISRKALPKRFKKLLKLIKQLKMAEC